MKARNFLGSYLQQEDIPEPTTVTITSSKSVTFEDDDKEKLALYFEELEKGMICNATNINLLIALLGSDETDDWVGKQVTLYVDPTIMFGGKKVGGIRIRSASPENY
jgi:hypothetical protein